MRTVHFNGVDGVTGRYLQPPQTSDELAARIFAARNARLSVAARTKLLALPFDVNPLEPERAGWAIVAHDSEAAMIRDALTPLFAHRHRKYGERIKFLKYSGQDRAHWLASYRVADDDIDPTAVPYYLLLAGSTEKIGFEFAHDLAVDYAVGRLELDSRDDYRAYAEQLVAYETTVPKATSRRVAFFGPRHDDATRLSADDLLSPLSNPDDPQSAVHRAGFTPTRDIGPAAMKQRLADILREADDTRPRVLFTASHGIGFPADHAQQRAGQGALLCHDWNGVGTIGPDVYFAASDVPADANVAGLIAFHFACYSAGTPERDRFYKQTAAPAQLIAKQPFIAALPKELLRRGALAVAGHVDRAWGYSIESPLAGRQIQSFENFLGRVLEGQPVGQAMRDFPQKYARHSVSLVNIVQKQEQQTVDEDELIELWTQRNDAGSYLVIGDPLARLRNEDGHGG